MGEELFAVCEIEGTHGEPQRPTDTGTPGVEVAVEAKEPTPTASEEEEETPIFGII